MASMSSQRKNFYGYLALFLFALLLRSLYLFEIKDIGAFSLLLGDAKSYANWAREISGGNWLGNKVFYQAPMYPYFLAVNYFVFGSNPFIIRLIQIFFGATACLLIARAGRHFFSNQVGLLAGFILAIYPTAIYFDGIIQKAVLNLFFMTLLLFLLGKNHRQPSGKLWFACGMVLACLGLTRENALILVVPIGLWLINRLRGEDKKKWIVWACLFFLGLSIVLFPVALRNKIVGGDFALTTAQFGPNFYMGNHHNASGMYEPLRGGRGSWRYEQQDAVALAEKAVGRNLSPNEVSRYWTQKTLDEILSNPGDWIYLMGKKWLLFWNFIENSDTESQYAYEIWSDILTVLGSFLHFGVIASLSIFGICITAKNYRQLWLLYLLVVFYSISVTLFFIFSRYRLPLLPILVMFAAAGIVQGFVLLRKKRIKVLTLSTAIALIGAMIFNWKIIPQDQEHFRALSLGNMCTESLVVGKAQQAVEYCLQSLKYDSRKVKVLNNLGAALIEEKRFEEALPVLQRAVKINPKIAKVHYNLEVVQSHIRASQTASHQLSDAHRMKPEE
jgi:4-amino-4-deoxy-L-arabinose transferase-like glycosyltransferase